MERPRSSDFKALPAYSLYVNILTSNKSTGEIATELERTVEDVELMELQLLNECVHCDTGEYFDDLPKGPEWLYEVVSERTDDISDRMKQLWQKTVEARIQEKK